MRCAGRTHGDQLAGGPAITKARELALLTGDLLHCEDATRPRPDLTPASTVLDSSAAVRALTQVLTFPKRENPMGTIMLGVIVRTVVATACMVAGTTHQLP